MDTNKDLINQQFVTDELCRICNSIIMNNSINERPILFNSTKDLEPIEDLLISKLNENNNLNFISLESITTEFDLDIGAYLIIKLKHDEVTFKITIDSGGYDLDFIEFKDNWSPEDEEKYIKIYLFLMDFFESLEKLVCSKYFNCKF